MNKQEAAVNYVTEKHNKQSGDNWYEEDESEKKAFEAGADWQASQLEDGWIAVKKADWDAVWMKLEEWRNQSSTPDFICNEIDDLMK